MGIFKKIGESFRSGISDGLKEGKGIRHPSDSDYIRHPSDSDYNSLSEFNNDLTKSDDEVWLEFKIYCKKYDPKIQDPNTQIIMERILEKRPLLKEKLLKDKPK